MVYHTYMSNKKLPGGTVHSDVPDDLSVGLFAHEKALATWLDITPLARNEWICLVITAKQAETRKRRIKRAYDQLSRGQRRPCCWIGCIHRTDKEPSPSVRSMLDKRDPK